MQVGIALCHSAHGAERQKVLAAQKQRQLACVQDLLCPAPDIRQGGLGRAEAKLQIAAVKDGVIQQIPVLIGAVGFDAEALVPHGGRAEAGARPEGRGGVKGRAEEDDLRLVKGGVAADEGLDVLSHFSTSCSSRSKNAGRQKAPTWRRVV